jgi:cell division protein ZipA
MSNQLTLTLIILAVGFTVVLPAIYWWSSRSGGSNERPREARRSFASSRIEPGFGTPVDGDDAAGLALDPELRSQLDELGHLLADDDVEPGQEGLFDDNVAPPAARRDEGPQPGARPNQQFDRIVSLFVLAKPDRVLRGPDLVVVAEKVGLVYGDMGIYHRLIDGREHDGPVFSMANIAKPGSFDLSDLAALESPGLTLFMTLPGPLPALDAWNSMLPVAHRIADLLDADLLDESRNPLVEQTVAYVRNEMRTYDREQERQNIRSAW